MTKEVNCSNGQCNYEDDEYVFPKECNNCTESEEIEHELMKDQLSE